MPKMGEGYLPLLYVGDGAGRYVKLPVLTTTQRDALTGVEGMVIFNSTTDQVEEYDGAVWEAVGKVYGDATFLKLAGGTMTGNIAMSGTETVDGVDVSAHAVDYGLHTKVVRKTADETVNNDDTLQDDDELLLAVAANEVWVFEIWVYYNTSATADISIALTVPAGAACNWGIMWINQSGNLSDDVARLPTESFGLDGKAENAIQVFRGIIVNGATAGNVQFQWAQNTAEVSDTKVLANSCIIATQLV